MNAVEDDRTYSYPEALRLSPARALRLGVEGSGPQENRDRLVRAQQIVDQANAARTRAYQAASWMSEPDVPEPVMAQILVRHDGDMSRAVHDPATVRYLQETLGLQREIQPVYDTWSDDPQPIFGKSRIVDPLREDPTRITDLRDAVNELRAGTGVGPIAEGDLAVAAGLTQVDQQAGRGLTTTPASSSGRGSEADATDRSLNSVRDRLDAVGEHLDRADDRLGGTADPTTRDEPPHQATRGVER